MPPPPDEIAYATALPPRRPTVVTVIAIIGICWSSFLLLGGVCNFFNLFVQMGPPNPVLDAMKKNAIVWNYTIIGTIIGWLMAGAMLAGCIAALNLKGWGRRMMVYIAALQIVTSIVGLIVTHMYMRPMLATMGESPDPAIRMGATFGLIMAYVGTALGMIYPIVVLFLMNKASVKAAFGEVPVVSK